MEKKTKKKKRKRKENIDERHYLKGIK